MTECQRLPAVIETAPKNPPQETSDSFDGCIVMPEQLETTVCWNSAGGLVIRQCNWLREDHWIIAEKKVDVFIDRLTDIDGIPSISK
jgi:hypothetical protein